jgi:N-acylglucosamine-6-phosphate 2-epimerase
MSQSRQATDSLRFILTETADPAVREFMHRQLRTFNDRTSEHHQAIRGAGPTPLDILIRDASGEILGGLIASTFWGRLELDVLWVEEGLRRQGYGCTLLRMAEAEARARGCSRVMLTTYSFQARGFYEKEGYCVVGEMADYPPGATYYWMRKDLQVASYAPAEIADIPDNRYTGRRQDRNVQGAVAPLPVRSAHTGG